MNTFTKFATASLVAVTVTGAGFAFAQNAAGTASDAEPVTNISFDEASAIALEAQPGTVEEIERDSEDGIQVFEVEIEGEDGEFEVVINAETGEILSVEEEGDGWRMFGDKDKGKKKDRS